MPNKRGYSLALTRSRTASILLCAAAAELGLRLAPNSETLRSSWVAATLFASVAAEGGLQGATFLAAAGGGLVGGATAFATGGGSELVLFALGLSVESLSVRVTVFPTALVEETSRLFALCVTTPSKQAACAEAASALGSRLRTCFENWRALAATLASLSTSRLARQSTAESRQPLDPFAWPIALCGRCAVEGPFTLFQQGVKMDIQSSLLGAPRDTFLENLRW